MFHIKVFVLVAIAICLVQSCSVEEPEQVKNGCSKSGRPGSGKPQGSCGKPQGSCGKPQGSCGKPPGSCGSGGRPRPSPCSCKK